MGLLDFARGPGLALAVGVFVIGCAWRLSGIFRRPVPADFSEARADAAFRGALQGIWSRMWHHRTFRGQTLAGTINAYAYHLGLLVIVIGFVPHIDFVHRLVGIAWPAVPGPVFTVSVALTVIGLLYALMVRLTSPVLRLISNFDDWFSWCVTILPVLTGMAIISLPLDAHYPLVPAQPTAVAIHLLSLELLLVWLPFGKLAHAFLVFVSRGTTGAAFARKGAAL